MVADQYSDTWNIATKISTESRFRVLSTWLPREYRDVQLFSNYVYFIEYHILLLVILGPSASVNIIIILFAAVRSLDVWWLIRDEVSVKMDNRTILQLRGSFFIDLKAILLGWLFIFSYLAPVSYFLSCFPALGKCFVFSRVLHQLHVFPRLASITCFSPPGYFFPLKTPVTLFPHF